MSTPGQPEQAEQSERLEQAAQPGLQSSASARPSGGWLSQMWSHLPTLPEAFATLLSLVVVALFLNTFVLQPYLIPSESMERTLLVGDFLLVNKQVYAPSGGLTRWFLPYRSVERGDIVFFHHPQPPFLVKRVVGVPGDRLHIEDGRVTVNGVTLNEPYAAFEPAPPNPFRDDFPAKVYTDPTVDPGWWKQMQSLTRDGELVVPEGEYFVLGDNRNHSKDSRFFGLVRRADIVARPLFIYFSVSRPSSTDVQQAADDRLGHDKELSAKLTGFARWKRIFHVVH
jgi:signal peptidase I